MAFNEQNRPPEDKDEIRRLGKLMDAAHQDLLRNKEHAKQTYQEMKQRFPEFWKQMGFESEEQYLRHFDLNDLVP